VHLCVKTVNSRHTESLFDRVAQRWRFRGPVQLIAGTDLAARTTDPADVLVWLQGHLATRYVRHAGDIGTRLAGLDVAPDPDGRFRVNELYCHDDTWRPTLQALLDVSDRVLADLRGFGRRTPAAGSNWRNCSAAWPPTTS
jgi:hypothetical protein